MKRSGILFFCCLFLQSMIYGQISSFTDTTAEDYFENTKEVSIVEAAYTGVEKGVCVKAHAQKGIFWSEADGSDMNFVAYKYRDTVLKRLEYTITEYMGAYQPISVSFGSYCENGNVIPFTLDLRNNALLQLEVESPETDAYQVNIRVWLKDLKGQELSLNQTILKDIGNPFNHFIGFSELHKDDSQEMPSYLSPGETKLLKFDFNNALSYKKPFITGLSDIYTDNSNFDFSKVKSLFFQVTNLATDEQFQPLDLIEKKLHILRFSLGVNPVVTKIVEYENVVSKDEQVKVYDIIGNQLFEGKASEASVFVQQQTGLYVIKSQNKVYKTISY